jgi:heme/copper-type cytochrome/quinol oxidase subunit 3
MSENSSLPKSTPNSSNGKDVFEGLDPEIRIRTKKMLMYFIIFAIVMLFAGFTSAYIVSNIGNYWVHIEPTTGLWISNVLIVISSITMILSLRAMQKGKVKISQIFLGLTLLLGVAFTVSQRNGWQELADKGLGWTVGNNEEGLESYRWNNLDQLKGEYGVDYTVLKDGIPLIYDNGDFYRPDDTLKVSPITSQVKQQTNSSSAYIYALILVHILHLAFGLVYLCVNMIRTTRGSIHPGDTVRLYTNSMYWHFLGILWLYLFVFLFIIH